MQALSQINPIVIQANSRPEFFAKIDNLLLSPPEWVSHHVKIVRETLDSIPSEISRNYTYAPRYSCRGVNIEFECRKNNYKLSLTKDAHSIESALQALQIKTSIGSEKKYLPEKKQKESKEEKSKVQYSGPVTLESISQFPSDLRPHASKLAESEFPYKTTIKSDGSVKVGGSVTFVGKTINLADLLKEN